MTRKASLRPLLTSEVAKKILEGRTEVSLDLGLTLTSVDIRDSSVVLPDGSRISFEDLRKVARHDNAVFFAENGRLYMVATSNRHYYKMVPTKTAPTLEVDGIRMHRTKGTTPDADAAEKVKALGIRDGRVLDTCAGLGYTAQFAAKSGAEIVVSVELRPEVLRIAEMNPWSVELFASNSIHLLLGDSFIVLDALPKGFFDYVIHDPPRIALAGLLYSRDFYVKLFEALRAQGRLFHYTGEPGSRYRGIDLHRGVMRRLAQAGFKDIIYHRKTFGVTCDKPG